MKKLFGAALLLALLAGAGWFYMSPVFALQRLQAAADAGDADALRDRVDFPALRQSLKDEARGAISGELERRSGSGGLGSVGAFLGGAVIDRVVDVTVQPDGIAALTRGIRPSPRGRASGGEADPELEIRRGYESLDRFVVSFHDPGSGEQRLALVLRRDGLADWRLSGVRLRAE